MRLSFINDISWLFEDAACKELSRYFYYAELFFRIYGLELTVTDDLSIFMTSVDPFISQVKSSQISYIE